MDAEDVPVDGTFQCGPVTWTRITRNTFRAELGGPFVLVKRPPGWKRLKMEKPWRLEVFGMLHHPAHFRRPVGAMAWAAKVALQHARRVAHLLDSDGARKSAEIPRKMTA